jgi:hypothetical protein
LGRVAENPVAAYDSGVCSTIMKQQPYTQEDLDKVAEYATITLRAIAPLLKEFDLSKEMEVDCVASDIAKVCYAMGICMIEEHENARLAMGKVNKELYEDNK